MLARPCQRGSQVKDLSVCRRSIELNPQRLRACVINPSCGRDGRSSASRLASFSVMGTRVCRRGVPSGYVPSSLTPAFRISTFKRPEATFWYSFSWVRGATPTAVGGSGSDTSKGSPEAPSSRRDAPSSTRRSSPHSIAHSGLATYSCTGTPPQIR